MKRLAPGKTVMKRFSTLFACINKCIVQMPQFVRSPQKRLDLNKNRTNLVSLELNRPTLKTFQSGGSVTVKFLAYTSGSPWLV